jgi:putative transposase
VLAARRHVPRRARIVLPNCPHHVVHRGHNRQRVFLHDEDYAAYLRWLRDWKARLGVRVYAYCLMTNHVHIVVDPGEDPSRIALLMKRIAARQTRAINRRERRSGTLWESRYHSTPVDTENYLLACLRYVELNPVRGGLVQNAEEYRWSSYRQRLGFDAERWIDLDVCYRSLGESPTTRAAVYAEYVASGARAREAEVIRAATQRGQIAGNETFIDAVAASIGRRVVLRGRGRPRSEPTAVEK